MKWFIYITLIFVTLSCKKQPQQYPYYRIYQITQLRNFGENIIEISREYYAPGYGHGFFFTTDNGLVYETYDLGQTWSSFTVSSQGSTLEALYFYQNKFYVFDKTNQIIKKSLDHGASWTNINGPITPNQFKGASIGSGNPIQYWIYTENEIFFSDDEGATWNTILELTDGSKIEDLNMIPGYIGWYRDSNGDLYQTVNDGQSWTLESANINVPLIHSKVSSDKCYAIGSDNKVYLDYRHTGEHVRLVEGDYSNINNQLLDVEDVSGNNVLAVGIGEIISTTFYESETLLEPIYLNQNPDKTSRNFKLVKFSEQTDRRAFVVDDSNILYDIVILDEDQK